MKYARAGSLSNTVLLTAVLFWGSFPGVSAQGQPPYLKSATLTLASDGWVDIWLNGVPIRESQPSTPDSKGFQTIQCLPEHLCYFQNENVLAIENANAFRESPPLNRQIGTAYVLQLRFSDGSIRTLSSNDLQDHRAYYLPDRETGEPLHWQAMSFNDAGWSSAYSLGTTIPGVARLPDPGTGQAIPYLASSGATFEVRTSGERHLYRREFNLDIRPNPGCSGRETVPLKQSVKTVRWVRRPSLVSRPPTVSESTRVDKPAPSSERMGENRMEEIHPRVESPQGLPAVFPTATLVSTVKKAAPASVPFSFAASPTKIAVPAKALTPAPTPTPAPVWPPPTWTPVVRLSAPTVMPQRTPLPAPNPRRLLTPTAVYSRRPSLQRPTPTAVLEFGSPNRADPFEIKAPMVLPRVPTPVPSPATGPALVSDGAQTIVFESQPANIYINYADGAGTYRLEVIDSSLRPIRALFEKRVVAQQDDWVEWDGKDDAGREMPPGQYTVLYTKDGTELNKLILVKTADR